jgi:hypothetical protein
MVEEQHEGNRTAVAQFDEAVLRHQPGEIVPHVGTDVVLVEMFGIPVLATVKTDQQGDHL